MNSSRYRSPSRSRRNVSGSRLQNGSIATEAGIKLGVNAVLATIAVSSLIQISAYSLSQQANLREVKTEVADQEEQVIQLRAQLHRLMDNSRARTIMQEQSLRVDSNRYSIMLMPLAELKTHTSPDPLILDSQRAVNPEKFTPVPLDRAADPVLSIPFD